MTRLEQDLEYLREAVGGTVDVAALPSGANLVEIRDHRLPAGWSRTTGTILFVAPPAFPVAKPDCFWVEPTGLRLANGDTPQATNDSNPIPEVPDRQGTWFSWHLQDWNPNHDSLLSYFRVIEKRLYPPR